MAGMDLAHIKRDDGCDLALEANFDIRVLCRADLQAVCDEVNRCLAAGATGGGYMIASCTSICAGMNPAAVAEFCRYAAEAGI